jgi:hypothetical protein
MRDLEFGSTMLQVVPHTSSLRVGILTYGSRFEASWVPDYSFGKRRNFPRKNISGWPSAIWMSSTAPTQIE